MLVILDADLLLDSQGNATNEWVTMLGGSLRHQARRERVGSTVTVRIVILVHSIGGKGPEDRVPWDRLIGFLRSVGVPEIEQFVTVCSAVRSNEIPNAHLALAVAINPVNNPDVAVATHDGIVLCVSNNELMLQAARWYSFAALTGGD